MYLILALIGLSFILAIPLRAAENSLNINQNVITGDFVYPRQWDILVMELNLQPAASDTLQVLTVGNRGLAPHTYLEEVRLYADDGDGVFEGWQKDTDLGAAVKGLDYMSQYMWYWQDLNVSVPVAGKRLFVTVKIARNSSLLYDRKTVQMALQAFRDSNSDGVFDPMYDEGIFMASKNNGPQDELLSSGIFTIYKTGWDSLAPQTIISAPTANQQLESRQVVISGLAKDQGDGTLDKVLVTVKNEQGTVLADKVQATLTDWEAGKWEYAYTFSADGKYTVTSQGVDTNANTETPGSLVTFTIGTTVTPPPVIPPTQTYAFGDLIKSASYPAVYYYGNDGKRYAFFNSNIFYTWYAGFSTVKTITADQLAAITLGGNVTFKPGTKMVKIQSDPRVYAISKNGTLRWITTEALAVSLYGSSWGSLVEDVSVALFLDYKQGTPITGISDYSVEGEKSAATTISADKGL